MAKQKTNVNTKSPKQFLLSENSKFQMREDYKALRTNISFSFSTHGSKVISVTSSSRREGKSTTAINLAISYASLGERVLLIDGDFRLPTVASKLRIRKKEGLKGMTDYLVGNANIDEVLLWNKQHGIYVICAGTIPPDPTRLLQSAELEEIINQLKKSFTYIIIDCPPIGAVIDAALISRFVDGYILVVRHMQTEHKGIAAMLEQLERAKANVLGFVYTNAPVEGKKYYQKYGGAYSSAYE